MAPPSLKKLISLQKARSSEIELISTGLSQKPRNSFNLNIVTSRIAALNEIWSNVRTTHADIITREESEDDVYVTENVFASIQSMHQDAIDVLLTLKTEFERDSMTNPGPSSRGSTSNPDFRSDKLPKLDLPTFGGQYEDWENFCDLFSTLVHDNPGLADATKLQYLKSCLKDTVAELVKDVSTTDANYATTWQALKTRFHNPRLIVYSHLRALMEIPYMKRESAVEMRSLADDSQRIVRALTTLQMPVRHWDVWIVFILAARLDPESRKAWEIELSRKDRRVVMNEPTGDDNLDRFPKFTDLTEFLENRAQTLCMIASEKRSDKGIAESSRHTPKPVESSRQTPKARKVFHTSSLTMSDGKPKCPLCAAAHRLHKCYKFKEKPLAERRLEVRRLRLCYNCFGSHRVAECASSFRCSVCKGKHNSSLHPDNAAANNDNNQATRPNPSNSSDGKADKSAGPTNVNVHTASASSDRHLVILATAQMMVVGPRGMRTCARALLDQGSEASFVTDAVANLLGLRRSHAQISLTGIGASHAGVARAATPLKFQSLTNPSAQFDTEALILLKITSRLPSRRSLRLDLKVLAGLPLADPQFHVPDSVDIILGADIYGQLLQPGLKGFSSLSLVAQNTALGWIISGPVPAEQPRRAVSCAQISLKTLHCGTRDDLDESLQRFWTLEEIPPLDTPLDAEDEACEKLFREMHTRDANGRFIVHLPFASALPEDGAETRQMALSSLNHTYRRFDRDSKLACTNREFMSSYKKLGHMERVPVSEINNPKAWYLPHHPVISSTGSKYKVRIVFDAKRKIKGKHCCNDFLQKGPALQLDLSLVLNWRRYRFVFTADIVKMFRQISVTAKHRDFQRIVWAPHRSENPIDYRLTTVTYGTVRAPYLAIRTLQQIAVDQQAQFPLGAQCLKLNSYVDDTFAGGDELQVAMRTRQELVDMLRTAGIELDKWAANHPDLLASRNTETEDVEVKATSGNDVESVKTLGLHSKPDTDEFKFATLNFEDLAGASTKRSVLSNIARLFDPLGWLAPITITAKILMQDLGIIKCDRDEALPTDVRERWINYCNSLSILPDLSISRWFGSLSGTSAQIHGYSDASSRAFAAAVYIRLVEEDGQCRVSLLAAKSKVAPVKTVIIPNLELCGAVLLVKLLRHVRKLDCLQSFPIFAWSDSQIVLTWLRKHPCSWKTFVANRVSFIQTELPSATWAHVPTKENPADLATRGCKPVELINANLWWHGPEWLAMSEEHWPKAATVSQVMHVKTASGEPELLRRFSSLSRLSRVVAYCLRPLKRLQRRKSGLDSLPNFITASELSEARNTVVRLAQAYVFAAEIKTLQEGRHLQKGNALLKLDPSFDAADGVLRVGGPLRNSSLSIERKHPPILPRDSSLSRLIVQYAHRVCLHGGPTLTSNTVLQYAWIVGRNRLVKTTVLNCIICQRNKPRLAHQMMGDLPASRVTPARPFSSSGLDYAGPFQIRTTKGRGHKAYKGYIALFVCFVTRAIHLEAVSDLTTKTFLAAYKRFTSRRGICNNLYSDNASTFQAADKELREMFRASSEFYKEAAATLANDGTSWTFITPTSPHYGGLWEPGVKSVKHHLRRTLGESLLTFEEFTTVLAEIEACLNSRPLCALSDDAEDLQACSLHISSLVKLPD